MTGSKERGDKDKIALALSGGGVRAAVFHSGVLKWLAEEGRLEDVSHISTVSGGSLFVGLVFHFAGNQWPTSDQYLQSVLPSIRKLLTTTSLQWNAFGRLVIWPPNWRFVLSRANVVAKSIEKLWGVHCSLGDLPTAPEWSINGTNAETGRRFRFKGATLGDYEIGYAKAERFKLSRAMAVSAGFPLGIGPLTIKPSNYNWRKKRSWDAKEAEPFSPPFSKFHLYDGGVYDNLGMEPFFDMGRQTFKNNDFDCLVVSDVATSYKRETLPGGWHPFRAKRVVDVMMDQVRSLRVRSLSNFIKANPLKAMYIQLGFREKDRILKRASEKYFEKNHLNELEVEKVSNYPTNLCKIDRDDFDLICRHAFEVSYANDNNYLNA